MASGGSEQLIRDELSIQECSLQDGQVITLVLVGVEHIYPTKWPGGDKGTHMSHAISSNMLPKCGAKAQPEEVEDEETKVAPHPLTL
eukprot:1215420-Amphidinium_carterae.1